MIDLIISLLLPQIPMSHYQTLNEIVITSDIQGDFGFYYPKEKKIEINLLSTKEDLSHEIGHHVYFSKGISNDIWGKKPFISEYAKTNKYEDFAETYREYFTGTECKKIKFNKKCREIRKLIDSNQ